LRERQITATSGRRLERNKLRYKQQRADDDDRDSDEPPRDLEDDPPNDEDDEHPDERDQYLDEFQPKDTAAPSEEDTQQHIPSETLSRNKLGGSGGDEISLSPHFG
jgi:hypothetical protein